MMCVKMKCAGILVLEFVIAVHCALKSFRHDNDIFNPHNWVDGKPQKECDGLIFPKESYSPFVIDKLEVDSLVLSDVGHILFADDAIVEFNSESKMNCVELKRLIPHFWSNPSSWITVGEEGNNAIPHMERLPCEYDDVVFPYGDRSGFIFHFGEIVKVKSFKFGNDSWTNEDLASHSYSLLNDFVFVNKDDLQNTYYITNKGCADVTGCICGNTLAYVDACDKVPEKVNMRCTDPVIPIGFCQPICGASIRIVPSRDFKLAEVKDNLKKYTSNTYVSKVNNDVGNEFVQIVFTEENFTGNSLDEAMQLFEQIKFDSSPDHVTLYASGPYNNDAEYVNNAVSIVFGTLCGVALVFVIMFFIYSPNGTAIMLRNRLNIGARNLPSLKTAYFTRHSSVAEDAGLIFGGHSMASSVLSLDKSFENPMYGQDAKTSASTSMPSFDEGNQDAGNSSVCNPLKSEVEMKKSMSDVDKYQEIDNNSEGELVDLSDM